VKVLEYSKRRVLAALDTIKEIRASEFPYPHSKEALDEIDRRFTQLLDRFKLAEVVEAAAIDSLCSSSVRDLFEYLPLLGFILRSTNVRNAFEVYRPLLQLSQVLLGPDKKLLISSEWDYSPFTYYPVPFLPGFVLIGIPATESSNPLLIPLAGHELGHSLWVSHNYRWYGIGSWWEELEKAILTEVRTKRWEEYKQLTQSNASQDQLRQPPIPEFDHRFISTSSTWAIQQAEETFCDFVGLKIFGESYLYAFAYLFAPGRQGDRLPHYPNIQARIKNLTDAAGKYEIEDIAEYSRMFSSFQEAPLKDPILALLLSLSDSALKTITDDLMDNADKLVTVASIPVFTAEKRDQICKRFNLVVPAVDSGGLANILNAGWKAFHDLRLWQELPHIPEKEKSLEQVILKSIEILEIEQRVRRTP
jgi:hypothetical protein